ncbi:hypothetical protein B0H13DRAFT_2346140 [Mycena leptocephala]|nr:hypothetical protein B0H13DRAFT_2346140 [Mycena leptocephala]
MGEVEMGWYVPHPWSGASQVTVVDPLNEELSVISFDSQDSVYSIIGSRVLLNIMEMMAVEQFPHKRGPLASSTVRSRSPPQVQLLPFPPSLRLSLSIFESHAHLSCLISQPYQPPAHHAPPPGSAPPANGASAPANGQQKNGSGSYPGTLNPSPKLLGVDSLREREADGRREREREEREEE